MVEQAPEGIAVVVGPEIRYVNPAAVRMFGGKSAADLTGCAVLDRVHPDHRPSVCERGWATKTPNPRDARSSLVDLTEAGRDVLVQARRERAAVVTERLRSDPHHDEQDLATAVAVIRGLLEQPDDEEEGRA